MWYSAEEIWDLLELCANGNLDIAFDAFYPEYYHALIPYEKGFEIMTTYKQKLIKDRLIETRRSRLTYQEKTEIQHKLNNHPIYGMCSNIAFHPLFDYLRFFEFFKYDTSINILDFQSAMCL